MKFKEIKNKYGYVECFPKPNAKFLKNFYKNIYFKKKVTKSFSDSYSKQEILNKKLRAEFEIQLIKKNIKKKNINFLEIGSGEGYILNEANKCKDWNVVGVDFNSFAIDKFNKKVKKLFFTKDPDIFLDDAIKSKSKFDIIVLNNVLEHVINPKNLLKQIRKITNNSSTIFISIPNDYSILQTMAAKNKKHPWFQPPQHITYFNTINIKPFLRKNYFEIIDMVSNFPIEVFLFSKFSYYYNSSKKGKSVHKARLILENLILSSGFEKAYKFFNSCCNLGFGRNFSVIIKKKKVT